MQRDGFLLRAHLYGIPIMDRRSVMAVLTGRVNVADIDLWSFVSSAKPQTAWMRLGRIAQSLLEPVLALIMLILFAPIFIAVAVAIELTSPGPVFYSQRRTGHMGKIFMLYKFRSMRTDSEAGGHQWAQKHDLVSLRSESSSERRDSTSFPAVECRETSDVFCRPPGPTPGNLP